MIFNRLYVNLVFFVFFGQKNGAPNELLHESSMHQKLDQVSILFPLAIQSRLASHFMDIEGWVLVPQTERYKLSLTYKAS